MTLIKSISGIRGTIGGKPGDSLSPLDVVKFTAAFGSNLLKKTGIHKVVIGRDARPSGELIADMVSAVLRSIGADVVDLGLASTPTVEMAVTEEKAAGGIIITASHNPIQWNALKLLNARGEFISEEEGKDVLNIAEQEDFIFSEVKKLGTYTRNDTYLQKHIESILSLPLVDKEAVSNANLRVAVDGVNSVGGIAVPALLRALGVKTIKEYHCEPTGFFSHNPEPLPEHLTEISSEIGRSNFDLGIVTDPDVDRLAFICEDGSMFGEEYTLVAVADYILKHQRGNTVSNLSSTKALKDITEKAGGDYYASAVGEVHVVAKMKACNAVIGGEGNGGIIYPKLHYGRDALVGIALFLSHLAKSGKKASVLRKSYPDYHISKNKIELSPEINISNILETIEKKYSDYTINKTDGLRIDFDKEWVHLRRSNTEPIIRIYAESDSDVKSEHLAAKIISDIKECLHPA